MREETRTRPESYTVYITSDGQEFTSQRMARNHEDSLMPHRNIPTDYVHIFTFDDLLGCNCYKIESEEDLKYLNALEWNHNATWDYEGPGWYVAFRSDGGDYDDDYSVSHIQSYIYYLKHDLSVLEELEKQ